MQLQFADDIPAAGTLNQRGFALLGVIWSLGLIVLLGTALIIGAKYRSKVSYTADSVARLSAAAEASINLAIAAVLTPDSALRFPLTCRLPGGERTLISMDEEIGKVDLNAASSTILERLFAGLARDKVLGSQIAAHIVAARAAKATQPADERTGRPLQTASPPPTASVRFTSIMELDGISGVSPDLFRKALAFVTVKSGRSEPDRDAASPLLAQMLGLQSSNGSQRKMALPGHLTIHAEVTAPDGSRYVRDALVSVGTEPDRPYVVREWRRGYAIEPDAPAAPPVGARPCFGTAGS